MSVVVALAAAAVVAGGSGYPAITGWVSDVPAAVLVDRYLRAGALSAGTGSKTTIWRVRSDVDAEAVDAVMGQWLRGLAGLTTEPAAGDDGDVPGCVQLRLEGKTIRGAKDAEGNPTQLLAALVGPDAATSMVATQIDVGAKTNEVPMAADVLGQIDLNNQIVTADARHTGKATAQHIHERGGQFVLPVKENRRSLFDALDALACKKVPIAHRDTDKGHGRITTRTIQVLPAPPNLPFPHVNHVFLAERHVSDLRGQPISAVAAVGITSPAPGKASPADLAGRPGTVVDRVAARNSRHPLSRGQIPKSEPDPGPES